MSHSRSCRSNRTAILAALLAASLAGCGLMTGEPVPAGLAYGTPDPNPATYTFSDTTTFSIDSGVGPMEVVTGQSGTAELDFRSWRDDRRVVVRFPEYRAMFSNPMQGTSTADASDISGPFIVHLSAAGRMAVTDTPSLGTTVLDVAGPSGLVRPLFVHLPGRPAEAGARWVDTVAVVDEGTGTRSEMQSIITSTLVGDTLIDGQRLLRIRTETATTIEMTGVSGGVDIKQHLAGTLTGTILWDEAARLMVESMASGELTGTLELPGIGVPSMAVQARLDRRVTIRP